MVILGSFNNENVDYIPQEFKGVLNHHLINRITYCEDYVFAHLCETALTADIRQSIQSQDLEIITDEYDNPIVVAPLT